MPFYGFHPLRYLPKRVVVTPHIKHSGQIFCPTAPFLKKKLATPGVTAPVCANPPKQPQPMTRKQLWNMKSTLLRKTALILGIAASTLILSPSTSFAGATEKNTLESELGKPLSQATTAEILTALQNVITNTGLNPAILAGEALKGATGPGATDFGDQLGDRLNANTLPEVTNLAKFVGLAAKTAATGKLANTLHITAFATAIFADDTANTDALAAAKAGIGSKTAAGMILGGRASGLSDADATALALASLQPGSVKAAAQATSQFVGATVTDAVAFAKALVGANLTLVKKIAPGTAAGHPVDADNILDGLLTGVTRDTTLKAATALAKSMATAADTEVVTDMAITFGGELNGGGIKFSKLSTIAKGLTQGLVLKPANESVVHGRDSFANKLDEIGEVAAYLFFGVRNRPEFDSVKKTPALVVKFIKTMIKAARIKTVPSFQLEAGDDVAGSVAQTIFTLNSLGAGSPFAAGVFDAIKAKLLKPSTAKSIGGKNSALVAAISAAFTKVFNGTAGTAYEDGTLPVFTIELTQPETDNRNG
jgi:hypothetical protein